LGFFHLVVVELAEGDIALHRKGVEISTNDLRLELPFYSLLLAS
jgi:hypothetical protein